MIALTEFGGVIPRTNAGSLPPNAAQIARNCTLYNNDLRPLKGLLQLQPHNRGLVVKSMHKMGMTLPENQYWLTWGTDVNAVTGPVAADVSERTYFTGDGYPRVTDLAMATQGSTGFYPVASYRLGIPQPVDAPQLQGSGNTAPVETRTYVYTYVSAWGEEGKPSPFAQVNVTQTGSVQISGMSGPPAGNYNITRKRIYRSSAGVGGNAILQLVAEIPIANSSFNDTVAGSNLGGPLETANFDAPPEGLQGLIGLPNGMMAAFEGNDVYFCEPNTPYAWPAKYRRTMKHKIVGLGKFGVSLVVLTTGFPVVISGTHPEAMSEEEVLIGWACSSKRSIVSMGDGVLYASPAGIALVGAGVAKLITLPLFTEDEWQPLGPTTIEAYWYEGKYIAFGPAFGGFILNSQEDASLTFFDEGGITAAYADIRTAKLYVAQGADIKKFAEGPDRTLTWRSRRYASTGTSLYRFARVDADAYPLTVNIYVDGVLHQSKEVTNNGAFLLKPKRPGQHWEFEIVGTQRVKFFGLVNDVKEFTLE